MRKIITITLAIVWTTASFCQTPEPNLPLNLSGGLAIQGFDAVGYFTEQTARKGLPEFSFAWQGATWQFANQTNLETFRATPEKYAPQYGGYCAYGASRGYKANTDPNAWTIVGDKLFLNYSFKVREEWLKDTANRIRLANQYWTTLK